LVNFELLTSISLVEVCTRGFLPSSAYSLYTITPTCAGMVVALHAGYQIKECCNYFTGVVHLILVKLTQIAL